jgi:hypothetical protein|tara:strand:+ start:122 stop:253 length:132 start_codon:yes stop_codon:yes gene_type:complete
LEGVDLDFLRAGVRGEDEIGGLAICQLDQQGGAVYADTIAKNA